MGFNTVWSGLCECNEKCSFWSVWCGIAGRSSLYKLMQTTWLATVASESVHKGHSSVNIAEKWDYRPLIHSRHNGRDSTEKEGHGIMTVYQCNLIISTVHIFQRFRWRMTFSNVLLTAFICMLAKLTLEN